MKVSKSIFILSIVGVLFLGIIIGVFLDSYKQNSQKPLINPTPTSVLNISETPSINTNIKNCFYNGKTYNSGEGFPSKDGCNNCSCEDGKVACTLMACDNN